jgi:hypothetical protein
VAVAGADGKDRTVRFWSATIFTTLWRFTIPPAGGISAIATRATAGRWALPIRHGMWSREMMIYRIVTYDKATERMVANLPIPWTFVAEIRKIAGVTPLDDGMGEYPLTDEQVRQIAQILHLRPEPEAFDYYLEPFNQPNGGLSQETSVTP